MAASSFVCRRVKKTEDGSIAKSSENLCTVWSFDGRAVYERIIEAAEEFGAKYCIGVGGHRSIYKA